jgi:hypothetical protein
MTTTTINHSNTSASRSAQYVQAIRAKRLLVLVARLILSSGPTRQEELYHDQYGRRAAHLGFVRPLCRN